MNVLVIGGDGFCGWPTSLELTSRKHKVVIVDNFMRRDIDVELGSNSITPIKSLSQRIETAKQFFSEILFEEFDVSKEYDKLVEVINRHQIDTIIHFGEIKAAPYSMISDLHIRKTVDHNMNATTNILTAITSTNRDIHLVHLGTMGVYGYKDAFGKIPEGYLDINVKSTGKDTSILFPTDPGSIYHMTKSMDQILFQYFNKNWGLKITDLHQGIVWGTQTDKTSLHKDLVNRFDYDGIYGTVLNRFIAESAKGFPLTVHHKGGQKRAFIHIQNTVDCVTAVVENPPTDNSKVRILNQVAEVHSIGDLANLISEKTGVEISYTPSPRKESEENGLEVENQGLQSLGFKPILLKESLIDDVYFIAEHLKENINVDVIPATVKWD